MNKILRTALALVLFVCASLVLVKPAAAQSVYGSLFGTVTDKTGQQSRARQSRSRTRPRAPS